MLETLIMFLIFLAVVTIVARLFIETHAHFVALDRLTKVLEKMNSDLQAK